MIFTLKTKKIKAIHKLRFLHIINHLLFLYVLFVNGFSFYLLYSLLVWNIIGCFGVSIGYHRFLAHKSFQSYKWFERFCILLGCFSTAGSPIGWAGSHRMHHDYQDTKQDPHSPQRIGGFKVHFHLWNKQISKKYIKDLLKNKFLVYIHKNYYKILILWISFLILIDFQFLIYTYCIPSVIAFHAFGFVNYLGHTFGYKNFSNPKDTSKNNWFVNLWTSGEGWHNNHHKLPSSYRIGFRWFEWDMSAFFLEKFSLMKSQRISNPKSLFIKLSLQSQRNKSPI